MLAACAAVTPPFQEISNARQTIQAAVEAGAEQAAPDVLGQARDTLNEASKNMEDGNYVEARNLAVEAKQYAIKARQTALQKDRKTQ